MRIGERILKKYISFLTFNFLTDKENYLELTFENKVICLEKGLWSIISSVFKDTKQLYLRNLKINKS